MDRLGSTRGLLVYGTIAALAGTLVMALVSGGEWPISGSREGQLRQTLTAVEAGEPPLLARNEGSSYLANFANEDGYYSAPGADDPGIYLYAPYLARLLGMDNVVDAASLICLLMFGVTIAIYPLLFRELFGSVAAALAAPILLLALILLQAGLGDIYWVSAWAVLTLVPVLLVLWNRWPRAGTAILIAVAVGASLATSIRSQAGLPIAIGALIVIATRRSPVRRRALLAVVVVAAYLSVQPLAMRGVEAYRDGQLDDSPIGVTPTRTHPFWHPTYLGLGFLENDYGIRWDDDLAARHAREEDPEATFATPEYEAALRERYLRFLEEHPETALVTTVKKGVASVFIAVPLLVLAIAGLWSLFHTAGREMAIRTAVLLAPAALLGLLPAVVVIPAREYAGAWIGALGLAALLGACAWIAHATRDRCAARAAGIPLRRAGAIVAGAITVVVIAGVIASGSIREECTSWQAPEPEGVEGWYTGCESSLYPLPL